MIEKLTPKQEELLHKWRDEWLKIGCSTEPIDIPKAEASITNLYSMIGKTKPCILWFQSPFQAMIAISLLKKCNQVKVNSQLQSQLGSQLRSQLWSQLGSQLESQLQSQLWSQLRSQLVSQLRSQLWSQLGSQLGSQGMYDDNYFWGQISAYYWSFYSFCNKIGVKYSEKEINHMNLWCDLAKSVCYWWPYDGICILSDRPSEIHWKDKVLHKDGGMAVKFRDGWGIYTLNGVRMEEKQVMTPAEKLNVKDIVNEKNVEQRRELIRKIGIERFILKSGAKVLDKKGDYELLSVRLSDEVPDARYLKMRNPSISTWHVEGVEGNTVQEALNFRAGALIGKGENWEPIILT